MAANFRNRISMQPMRSCIMEWRDLLFFFRSCGWWWGRGDFLTFCVLCGEWTLPRSPCRHPVFGPPFTPYPLFQWYQQSKVVLINLSMKCSYSAFNAQSSRLIIVVVQLGAVKKICSSSGGALRKKEKLSLLPKLMVFWVSSPVEC